MTFLSVGLQLCRWLPPDIPSRVCPCLKLVVVVARIVELIIWTLVLLQGTCIPLIHAHAGRTQSCWSGFRVTLVVEQRLFATAQPERYAAQSSVGLTYLMPYLVNIHGQFVHSKQSR